jgi:phosphopantothenoylcysteine synthetase/decarboxylase
MTRAATRFITPLTLASLSGHAVLQDELAEDADPDPAIAHIGWARWAHVVAIVPATADFIGRISNGLAGDSLSSLVLALEPGKPIVIAPAMNTQMWENPFVQANLERLRSVGGPRFRFVDPISKRLACGEEGAGGLAAPETILAEIQAAAPSS